MDQSEIVADGLATPEVGTWSRRKYHFLQRYLQLFSTGMKNKWEHRQYIDLFSGAGYARIKDTEKVVPTSALLAAQVDCPFTFLHLCEQSEENCQALKKRLARHAPEAKYNIYCGNANEKIDDILKGIPLRRTLAVAFIDPFGLHFDFETARKLSTRKVDLIILLADNMDAMRNWKKYYEMNPDSSMDRFIGEPGWREAFNKSSTDRLPEKFRLRYIEQLRTLGYRFFETLQVQNSSNRDIYSLLFATGHELGLKFWDEAKAVDEGGQKHLF